MMRTKPLLLTALLALVPGVALPAGVARAESYLGDSLDNPYLLDASQTVESPFPDKISDEDIAAMSAQGGCRAAFPAGRSRYGGPLSLVRGCGSRVFSWARLYSMGRGAHAGQAREQIVTEFMSKASFLEKRGLRNNKLGSRYV